MSEADSTGKTPFDLDRLQQLVEMMEKHGLSEVNLRRGDEQWRLRRGAREVVHAAPPQMTFAAPAPSAAPVAQSAAVAAPAEPSGLIDIKSPTVGTFYAAPAPDQPAYMSVGKMVKEGDVLCIIEAMKLMNEIKSELGGIVVEILVQNGQTVEYDQPILKIKKG